MRKIPNIIRIGAIVSIAWFAAAALTPLTSVAIRNSTIDSTVIGGTTASTAKFTNAQVTAPASSTVTQGGYFGWNGLVQGETDFVTRQGSGVGGFAWFNTNSGSPGSAIMQLSAAGSLTAPQFLGSGVASQAPYAASGQVNGAWIGWNQTGLGDMDFIAQHASSSGGFHWYDTTSPSSVGSAIMSLDSSGNLSARSLSVSSGLTGSLSGNASTSSAFDHNPANCPTGQAASGIDAAGAPTCVQVAHTGNGSACTTGSATFSSCTSTVTWAPGFPDNNYRMSCTIVSPSDARAAINGILTKTATTATVAIVTLGSNAVTFAGLDCVAQHN